MVTIKIDKVAITHLAMEKHFHNTDHVVAVEKVPEQHIETKYSKRNCLRVHQTPKILKSVKIH